MFDPGGETTPVRLEDLWRSKVDAARHRYYEASARSRSMIDERLQGLESEPDSDLPVRRAGKAEAAALHEYMKVLQIFTELIVHGKVPDE